MRSKGSHQWHLHSPRLQILTRTWRIRANLGRRTEPECPTEKRKHPVYKLPELEEETHTGAEDESVLWQTDLQEENPQTWKTGKVRDVGSTQTQHDPNSAHLQSHCGVLEQNLATEVARYSTTGEPSLLRLTEARNECPPTSGDK